MVIVFVNKCDRYGGFCELSGNFHAGEPGTDDNYMGESFCVHVFFLHFLRRLLFVKYYTIIITKLVRFVKFPHRKQRTLESARRQNNLSPWKMVIDVEAVTGFAGSGQISSAEDP